MRVEKLEQIAAVIVTAGLVAGNLILFAPWRRGQDPRERGRDRSALHLERRAVAISTNLGGRQRVLADSGHNSG